MQKKPVEIDDAQFENTVLSADQPVLVDFWAPWCPPCRAVAPILEELAAEYDVRLTVAKVNTDQNPQYAQSLGIQGIPTMILFHRGREVGRRVGALPKKSLRAWIDGSLAA